MRQPSLPAVTNGVNPCASRLSEPGSAVDAHAVSAASITALAALDESFLGRVALTVSHLKKRSISVRWLNWVRALIDPKTSPPASTQPCLHSLRQEAP